MEKPRPGLEVMRPCLKLYRGNRGNRLRETVQLKKEPSAAKQCRTETEITHTAGERRTKECSEKEKKEGNKDGQTRRISAVRQTYGQQAAQYVKNENTVSQKGIFEA